MAHRDDAGSSADLVEVSRSDGPVGVSVLVPVRNEEKHIRDAVRAMQAQRFDGRMEFLFADGRSHDRTPAILEQLAREDRRIRVLDNPARRTPSGLNVCLRHARGTYVARMDAHSLYPADYIHGGVERLRGGDVAWVTGPQIPQPVGRVSRAVALALGSWLGRGGSRKWETTGAPSGVRAGRATEEIELDTGVFAGVWRRDELLAHGGWDERWPVNQDSELAARFLARGQRIVCLPALGARYIPRDDLQGLARQYWSYGFYRARTARRHPDSLRASHLLTPGLALTVLAALAGPRPIGRAARAATAAYCACLAAVALGAAARIDDPRQAAVLPAALGAMHLSNGLGLLSGFVRFGVPLAALARRAGIKRLADRTSRDVRAADVFAPSLHGGSA